VQRLRQDERVPATARTAQAGPAAIPILLYHAISDEPPPWLRHWTVAPQAFAAHLDAAAEAGCTPLTVSGLVDALDAGTLPARPVVVTFDDGYADFLAEAVPALVARDVPATLYVTTGALVGAPRPAATRHEGAAMLRFADLARLEGLGIEVGPHTHTHPQLDAVSRARAAAEIALSKELVEDALGHRVRTFAYPHGYSDRAVRLLVEQAGFHAACGVREALSSAGDDRFNLARLTVHDDTPLDAVRAWLTGRGARLAPRRDPWRTRAWRWYRRAQASARRPGERAAR